MRGHLGSTGITVVGGMALVCVFLAMSGGMGRSAASGATTSGQAPFVKQFTDLSTGSPTAWDWDFQNDGTTDSSIQNPVYTYSRPGSYTVRLAVANSVGSDAEVKRNYITVTRPPLSSAGEWDVYE